MRLLGVLALAAGGSLLVSEPLLGQDLFSELTGTQVLPLRLICTVIRVMGLIAVWLGRQEEKELRENKGACKPEEQRRIDPTASDASRRCVRADYRAGEQRGTGGAVWRASLDAWLGHSHGVEWIGRWSS